MDCLVQQPIWTGAYHHGGLTVPRHHPHFYAPYYFPKKRSPVASPYYHQASSFNFSSKYEDDVVFPTDIKIEANDPCMLEDDKDIKTCVVCGERASGFYFGALVCLPCKSFYIRCTKDGEPTFTCQCNGNCDIAKQGRIRCQYCRYQRCLMAGMCRKEKPETVQPAEGQVLCKVCGDIANGIHFGVNTCEGCKKFFRRGLVENQSYICKGDKECTINPRNRNNCRYCRYQKCITVGMSREAIKMGRPKKSDSTDSLLSSSPEHCISSSDMSEDSNGSASPQSPFENVSNSPSSESKQADGQSFINFLVNSKKIKVEQSSDSEESEPSKKHCRMVTDLSYTQLTPLTDRCSLGSNTSSQCRTNCDADSQACWTGSSSSSLNSWHQPSNVSASQQGNMSASCGMTSLASTHPPSTAPQNPMSFIDDMDEILDYLQTEQATRKPLAPTKIISPQDQNQENFDFYPPHQFPQSQCIMSTPSTVGNDCSPQQSLSIDTNPSTSNTNSYSTSPVNSPNYPNSPCYSDASGHSPQYQPGSPSNSVQYPNSPVGSHFCNSPSNSSQYTPSPVHTTQYMNSPSSQYSQYPPSPDCMYPDSPADSHTSYCGSPRSSCQFSPSPAESVQHLGSPSDCRMVMKHEFQSTMSSIHNNNVYNTTENFTRSR